MKFPPLAICKGLELCPISIKGISYEKKECYQRSCRSMDRFGCAWMCSGESSYFAE